MVLPNVLYLDRMMPGCPGQALPCPWAVWYHVFRTALTNVAFKSESVRYFLSLKTQLTYLFQLCARPAMSHRVGVVTGHFSAES